MAVTEPHWPSGSPRSAWRWRYHRVTVSVKMRRTWPSNAPSNARGKRSGKGMVKTIPFPLRFPLAFDGALLGQVLRIFTDTVTRWYRQRQAARGLPGDQCGSVTAIHHDSSELRCDPHFHCLFLDGVYAPDGDGKGQMFHPAPAPTQQDVEQVVERASKRILRFLQRRGVITLVTAPGDGEVTVVTDETMGEEDPLLARLLAAATAGAPPAGPVNKRK